MMSESAIREKKDLLRKQAHANRNAQENKDDLSRRIVGAFMALPEYATAEVVMFYIDARRSLFHGATQRANSNCSVSTA